jgi:hypothetical protein
MNENLFKSGSGSGRFRLSDPDPVKNRPDPQHCTRECLDHGANLRPFC